MFLCVVAISAAAQALIVSVFVIVDNAAGGFWLYISCVCLCLCAGSPWKSLESVTRRVKRVSKQRVCGCVVRAHAVSGLWVQRGW